MRIFVLCKRFYTHKDLIADRFGRLYHLPAQLGSFGHKVTVVAADYRSRQPERVDRGDTSFHAIPFSPFGAVTFIRRTRELLSESGADCIVASGDSHLGAIGLALAGRLGIPFAFDVYDFYPAFKSHRIPLLPWLFRRTVRRADLVICASSALARELGGLAKATVVIENGVDQSVFRPRERGAVRRELGLSGTVVGYFGAIQDGRGVDVLIEACRRLRLEHPELTLLLAGPNRGRLDLALPWISYRGVVDQSEVSRLICACDAVTIPYADDLQVKMSNPCKVSEYLACRVPVVATDAVDFGELFASVPQALCRAGDAAQMQQALSYQLRHRRVLDLPESLTWPHLARRLEAALAGITRQALCTPGAMPRAS